MTAAIIVLYKCIQQNFTIVVKSLIEQVDFIILVKNDDEEFDLSRFNKDKIILIDLKKNFGIAYAQNRGVEKAKELKVDYLLFSDQDTCFPAKYIEKLLCKVNEFPSNSIYAPVFYNETKQQIEPISVKMNSSITPSNELYIKAFHVISSGTFVSMQNFCKIGFFNEKLFIDYVDFEWCWKAVSLGYNILCFPDLTINHHLGDNYKKIFGKKVTLRTNIRYYYMIRNGIYLSKNTQFLSKLDKKLLLKKTIIMAIGVLLLNSHFVSNFRTVYKAVRDAKNL